jgi:hypothetical protein
MVILSPSSLFFILFIADLEDFLRSNNATGHDIETSELALTILLMCFSDDTTLIADDIPSAQRLLYLLSQYASLNGLEVNVGKTGGWVMTVGIPRNTVLKYRDREITRKDSFRLLGYYLTPDGRSTAHEQGQRAQMLTAYGMWKRFWREQPGMDVEQTLRLFYTFFSTVGLYGSPLVTRTMTPKLLIGK